MCVYICRETSTKSLSPWEPRILTKGKEGIHAQKSRKYGNIFPFPPGSLQITAGLSSLHSPSVGGLLRSLGGMFLLLQSPS